MHLKNASPVLNQFLQGMLLRVQILLRVVTLNRDSHELSTVPLHEGDFDLGCIRDEVRVFGWCVQLGC